MRVCLAVVKDDTAVTSKSVRPKTSLRSSVYPKRNLDSSVAKKGIAFGSSDPLSNSRG